MITRLSRAASEAASLLSAQMEESVRRVASHLARSEERAFAEPKDVKEAYRLLILQYAEDFNRKIGRAEAVGSEGTATNDTEA